MNPALPFRPATSADASPACRLIYMTMGREADWLFDRDGFPATSRILEALFVRRRNRLSHDLAWLAEQGGRVTGLLLAYPGSLIRRLDLRTAWGLMAISGLAAARRLTRIQSDYGDLVEALPDEYYISNLAVEPECRGQGLGSALMALAEDQARAAGLAKCSLIVAENHLTARLLYERLGYTVRATYEYRHPYIAEGSGAYHRMVKDLPGRGS